MRFAILGSSIFSVWVGLVSMAVFSAIADPSKLGLMVSFFLLSFVFCIVHIFLDESIGKIYEPDKEIPESKKGEAIAFVIGFSGICAWVFTSAMYFYAHQMWIHLGIVGGIVFSLFIFAIAFFGSASKKRQQEEEYKAWLESQGHM